jgi:N-acetylmuramoyl-L-alanine amidase
MTIFEGLLWLTLNVYHEARSEPQIAQMAVALVTLNRANDQQRHISTVVQQPRQFSWTGKKASLLPDDPKAFITCLESVYLALQSEDFTGGATHFHLDSVRPPWAEQYTYLNQIGSHKFYKQTIVVDP